MSSDQPAPDPAPLSGAVLWVAAACLSLSNFTVTLDTSIANVSVPHIAGALAVSPSQGTWVITSYAVAEAVTVPLTGWLSQRFGSYKVLLVAMVGFGIASALCGLAPSFGALVACRVLQGLCGGPMMPMSQTLLVRIFPREKMQQGLALWSMTLAVGPIMGPILGGAITDNLGWSWIFFVNVPVAIAVVLTARMTLRGHDTPGRRVPVDYIGLAILVVWVGCLQVMFDKGRELEWFSSPTIVALGLTALLGFVAFLIWELTAENPIVDLRVFRHRGFVGAVTANSITFASHVSIVVLIPLWLQTTMGYTASLAGYAACLNGCVGVVVSFLVARLMVRFDARALVFLGLGAAAGIAFWRSHFSTDVTFWDVAGPYAVQGVATPFFFIPMTALMFRSVLPGEAASAAGLQNFMRTTAGAFGTSLMTTFWDSDAQARRYDLVARMRGVPATLASLRGQGLTAPQATTQLDHLLQTQAVMLATNQMFMVAAGGFAVAAACVWLIPRPTPAPASPASYAATAAAEA